MRIWSLHPKYLDAKGLVALWRETLLAKHVLLGKTKGYKNHPQLVRFKEAANPLHCIDQYLAEVYHVATSRGYKFDKSKIDWDFKPDILNVTEGQLQYELSHLLNKLKIRDKQKYNALIGKTDYDTHPMFKIIKGAVERWEIVKE